MKKESLGSIIKKSKASEFKELIEAKLAASPFSQPLQQLSNSKSESKANLHFVYDWYENANSVEFSDHSNIQSISTINISKKKPKKRKKANLSSAEDIGKTKSDNSKSKKKSISKLKKQKLSKKLSDSHWVAFSDNLEPELIAYTKWLNSIYPDQAHPATKLNSHTKKKKSKKNQKKRKKVSQYKSDLSIKSKELIISESLAQLYVKQGFYQKAIDMYDKLILKNPEKSSFFAPILEDLKSKIK